MALPAVGASGIVRPRCSRPIRPRWLKGRRRYRCWRTYSKLPHLLLLGGGIVIKVGDEVVGAIGAAGAPGGDLDDACARAGLDKIKDQLK
jgi:uncharacterized protein GlcG (DUF336 family)